MKDPNLIPGHILDIIHANTIWLDKTHLSNLSPRQFFSFLDKQSQEKCAVKCNNFWEWGYGGRVLNYLFYFDWSPC